MSNYSNGQNPKKAETLSINGKGIYYEVYGEGNPLFLLHGYGMSSKSWKSYVNNYNKEYEVYLVDLTGHGKSELFRSELSIPGVAEDLNQLINHLGINKIKAIGFSFGGDVLYQLALIRPSLIESMITIGAVGSWTANDFKHFIDEFTYVNRTNFPWLSGHSSDEHVKEIMNQFKNYSIIVSDHELQQIQSEVLIILGDDDQGIDILEVARARKNLQNSDLWILPNVSHGAHEGENKEEFIIRSKTFFNKQNSN